MDTPFLFGKLAFGDEFTDRKVELKRLRTNFSSGTNSILISPRRWGKSSLVHKAAELEGKANKQLRIVLIDLFNVRTEADLYTLLGEKVLQATASGWEEALRNAKEFIGSITPHVNFGGDPQSEVSFGLDWQQIKDRPSDLLDLAEKIAKRRKLKVIVCIDEFQNIGHFKEPLAFQKKLRAHWQQHRNTSYCLYGSKRHMMLEVFASPSMPFYKFGELIMLEKIGRKDWVNFIQKRFVDTKKRIAPELADMIAEAMEDHPYYVQQLAQACWLRTSKVCHKEQVEEAIDSMVMQGSLLFQTLTEALSTTQVNYLQALLAGEEKLSAADTLKQYGLGTSANVVRIKEALQEKEILDLLGDRPVMLDPLYARWLRTRYFDRSSTWA